MLMSWSSAVRRLVVATIAPMAIVLVGCGGGNTPTDGGIPDGSTFASCDGVDCVHGACVESGNTAQCVCDDAWTLDENAVCATCALGWAGTACDTCATNFTGSACDTCVNGWAGTSCDTCDTNFTGANCDTCATGWSGPSCDSCDIGWADAPGGEPCSVCADGYAGANCDSCDTGHVPGTTVGECVPGLASTTDLVLWLDATDNSTLTTVFVSGLDYAVSDWTDKISGTISFSNTNDSNTTRPYAAYNSLNGKTVLTFDGSDWLQETNVSVLNGAESYAIFIVGNSSADDDGCFFGGVDTLLGDFGLRVRSNFSNRLIFGHDGNFDGADPDTFNSTAATIPVSRSNAQVMTFFRRRPAASIEQGVRVDGLHEEKMTGNGLHPAFTADFGVLRIGTCPIIDTDLTGQIGEILVHKGNITDARIAEIEAYLLAKWGL